MDKKRVISNSIYSLLLQAAALLFSLVSSPYLSQVLGADNLGKVNFTTAIAGWFVLVSTFGTSTYGVVAIAKVRDDKEELSKVFSELMLIKTVSTIVALAFYIIVGFSVPRFSAEWNLYLVQSALVGLNIFSIDWFFQGMENYKFITIRSIVFKVIGIAAMFMFIKFKQDYIIYALICIFSLSCSNLLNILYVKKYVKLSFKNVMLKRHMRALIIFLFSTLLINVYMMIDQTLLGFLKTDADVALFARARMFFNFGLVITGGINSALAPSLIISYKNDKEEYYRLLRTTCNLMMFFAVPIAAGLFMLAPQIMVLFGSLEFAEGTQALRILSMTIITVAIGTWNYSQRVVVAKKEKFGIYIITGVALCSVILNFLLIPPLGIAGAALSYFIVENLGNTAWYNAMYRVDKFSIFRFETSKYFLGAASMAVIIYLFVLLCPAVTWLNLIAAVCIGSIYYVLFCILFKEQITILTLKQLKSCFSKNTPQNIDKK